MNSRSWSSLPRELTDRIFRRNNINPKDLARCSLVCTTWRLVIGKSSLAVCLRLVEQVFLFLSQIVKNKNKKLCYRINDQLCCYFLDLTADIWGKNFSLMRTAKTGGTRRIVWDYKNFQTETFKGCKAELVDSLFHWEAIMIGPKDTPYADGVFLLKIYLSASHSFQPPRVKFLTKVKLTAFSSLC